MLICVPEARGKHALAFVIKLEPGETGILNLEEKPQLGRCITSVPGVGKRGKEEEVQERGVLASKKLCNTSILLLLSLAL